VYARGHMRHASASRSPSRMLRDVHAVMIMHDHAVMAVTMHDHAVMTMHDHAVMAMIIHDHAVMTMQ